MSKNKPPSFAMPINSCRQAARFRVMDLTGLDDIELADEGEFQKIEHFNKDVYKVEITNLGHDSSECYIDARNGELLFFNNLNQQKPPEDRPLPKELIKKILLARFKRFNDLIPEDAKFESVSEIKEEITGNTLYEVRWKNENHSKDYVSIFFNPVSEKIFNYVKKWSS
ncbi:MAG: hypothetical protein GF383_02675 [Candidatus Lokiarchaeota archaeon]|nr:hypothetical protein [Candidatus Lokiarchaeota archaeon]MBD3338337.1 hypothetical protein [Candidatus Lokiarchaeota archaeon]